jgi:hypothetical protein
MTSFIHQQSGGVANASSGRQQRQRQQVTQEKDEPSFPLLEYTQRVHYIRSVEQANVELGYLLTPTSDGSSHRQLGFDLEWKPTWISGHPENPVALVQLADEHNVFLVQVSAMEKSTLSVSLHLTGGS